MMLETTFEASAPDIERAPPARQRTHLDALEAESIYILREVAAEFANPVLMYSIGKDSAVLLHLLTKAFYPARPPMPLLHVDTGWKFQQMYALRDQIATRKDLRLIVHKNPDGLARGLSPLEHGSKYFTDVMKTQGLLQALNAGKFDAAIGGARRDEEASRAKERVFSFRNSEHVWDPKRQRPELWNLYNTRINKGESVRVFPLSNWTELDIWLYILRESIPVLRRAGTGFGFSLRTSFRSIRVAASSAATMPMSKRFSEPSSGRWRWRASPNRRQRTPCVIPLPRTCWRPATISARCRNCSATRMCRRR